MKNLSKKQNFYIELVLGKRKGTYFTFFSFRCVKDIIDRAICSNIVCNIDIVNMLKS